LSALSLLQNPCCHDLCGRDFFHGLFWPLLASIFLHIVVLGKFPLGHSASLAISSVERNQPLAPLKIVSFVANPRLQATGETVKPHISEPKIAKIDKFSRSTMRKPDKASPQSTSDLEADGDIPVVDEMEAAEYRLALARVLARLQGNDANEVPGSGEIVFELTGRRGQSVPLLKMERYNMAQADSMRWQILMQKAIDQTPLPFGWSGRAFKLPLTVQLLSFHHASGSACSACS
jgi:hypothetical protein